MKIGLESEYAMIAVAYVAQHIEDGLIKAITISKTYDIPHEYFLKVMQKLSKANVLKSKRGLGGGFTLAKPAKEITLLEIIEAIKGPSLPISFLSELTKNAPCAVNIEQVCNDATAKAQSRLGKTTIAKMIG